MTNKLSEHIDSSRVMPTLRHDHVSIAFAGLYKLLMHRFEHALIPLNHYIGGSSALHYIALVNAYQAVVCIRIHKDT